MHSVKNEKFALTGKIFRENCVKCDLVLHELFSQDFSVTQILREITFGEFRSSKNAIFAISAICGALNFANFVNFSPQRMQKFKYQNSESYVLK